MNDLWFFWLSADNYLLSNLIWFYVFDLTGDETRVPKMEIHALMSKSIEVTKSSNKELSLIYTSETWCIPKYGWDVDYSLCWPASCTVYTHTTIIVNSSQNWSISGQVNNRITSILASYIIVTRWDTHVTWLPADPRPLGRTCLGMPWWITFFWWPSNRHQRVEDQEPVNSSLVSECWIWCMWPIISICSPWQTSS
jgi:hypothetical protein